MIRLGNLLAVDADHYVEIGRRNGDGVTWIHTWPNPGGDCCIPD
jgi:hypothetical protein